MFALTYDSNQAVCFLKNKTALPTLSRDSTGHTSSAAANLTQFIPPTDLACPVIDNSTLNGYTVLCNRALAATNSIAQWGKPVMLHADTFEECLGYCDAAHPLCSSAAYNIDMTAGYSNCRLKLPIAAKDTNVPSGGSIFFSGLRNGVAVDASVPSNLTYTTANKIQYSITQYQTRTSATNFTSIHASSITSCIDNCSQISACKGVLLDIPMSDGYQNCYLLDQVGSANYGANYTFAMQTDQGSAQTSSETASRAWIAGVAVGFLIVVALLVWLWWYRRKRRYTRLQRVELQERTTYAEVKGLPLVEAQDTGVYELPQDSFVELPTRQESIQLDNRKGHFIEHFHRAGSTAAARQVSNSAAKAQASM